MLAEYLASAIANCCTWESNSAHFGELNMVKPLVSFMYSKNINIQRATALALHRLSYNPYNSVTLHRSGVVKVWVFSNDGRLSWLCRIMFSIFILSSYCCNPLGPEITNCKKRRPAVLVIYGTWRWSSAKNRREISTANRNAFLDLRNQLANVLLD